MNQILNLIQGESQPNIYQFPLDISPEELSQLCQEYGCELFYFDGGKINNKSDFLKTASTVMNLPEYFGYNWDVWEDCLTDLSWFEASSYLIVYDQWQNFAENYPDDWQILTDIFSEAIAYWQKRNKRFSVLLVSYY
ncbi:barstar family protein [Planktothrix sp. FACHB-1365]|uniref:barstar family protein n=1 Tax=Planktothrix sp. FACHB-1365 TaxID=2692855 RepID=UPI001688825E|nr:barstar family protein [Planktothrix sp. FACHB-1365]MBD2481462.1 barstar family protein [Planktothrix sp. FACHB-1365]